MVLISNKVTKKIFIEHGTDALIVESYGPGCPVYRLDSWDNGLSLSDTGGPQGGLKTVDMTIFSSKRKDSGDTGNVIDSFAASIPDEVIKVISPFSLGQLQALQILCQGGAAAIELAREIPILIWLLATAVLANIITVRQAVDLVCGKRIEIVKTVYSESTKKHLKLVSRVLPIKYSVKELRTLNGLLRDDRVQDNLRHCSPIVLPLVEEVMDTPDLQAIPCIQRAISNENGSRYKVLTARTMCETCLRLGSEAGLSNVRHVLRNCKTLGELTALTDRWHGRHNKKLNEEIANLKKVREAAAEFGLVIQAEKQRRAQLQREQQLARANQRLERDKRRATKRREARKIGFGQPPIPGNEFIVPITNHEDLVREGNVMNNCVASYEDDIVLGGSYIYKVYYPERCTLEVVSKKGVHSIGELKAKNNDRPPKGVRQYVWQWIQSHGNPRSDID
ncbi:MAG: PcfJ domain-containing protein [Pseudodesulfovibrio sp.]|nr:PcfJ domain-containing protein [Pseudodesulfovibrio sp.]